MTVKKTIFPVTRIHEPLKLDVEVDNGRVVNAWISAQLFRGFEKMMQGRDPRDAALFTQRICGICSCAHAIAASMAQQEAFGVQPTPTGQHLTNLIFAADIIQNHLRHFYLLVLPDYVNGPKVPLSIPEQKGDYRLPKKLNQEVSDHIKEGLTMAARAHEMMAIFGAKAPHQQTIMPTGITEQASTEKLKAYKGILQEITHWVETVHIPDMLTIAEYYKDYYTIGQGYGNLLSAGMFPIPNSSQRNFPAGIMFNQKALSPLHIHEIKEDLHFSWYKDAYPYPTPATSDTIPDINKSSGYSWTKAPRYQGQPFEGGPLARGWISGDYRKGISTMDRIAARSYELLKLCRMAQTWLEQIIPFSPALQPYTPASKGEGLGITDAMRGCLLHWLKVDNEKVSAYQIIAPSTWNFSPRDNQDKPGPVEQALIGTPIADSNSMIEVGRVLRAFDPCFSCAVHLLTNK